jgi:hypothetical protein
MTAIIHDSAVVRLLDKYLNYDPVNNAPPPSDSFYCVLLNFQAYTATVSIDGASNTFIAPGTVPLVNGCRVRFSGTLTGTALTAGQDYWVINVSGNTFQVMTTPGTSGTPFDVNNGSVVVTEQQPGRRDPIEAFIRHELPDAFGYRRVNYNPAAVVFDDATKRAAPPVVNYNLQATGGNIVFNQFVLLENATPVIGSTQGSVFSYEIFSPAKVIEDGSIQPYRLLIRLANKADGCA